VTLENGTDSLSRDAVTKYQSMLCNVPKRAKIPLTSQRKPEIAQNKPKYKGWNFNSGNYLFTNDTK